MQRVTAAAIAACGVCVGTASAVVVFQDNFEAHTVGNTVSSTAQVGTWSEGGGSGLHGADIVAAPALDTKSVRIARESGPPLGPSNGDLIGKSIPGAIVSGQDVEIVFSHYWQARDYDYSFNGPLQVAIGQVGSNFNNDLTFIDIADGNTGGPGDGVTTFPFHNYAYYSGPNQFGTHHQSLTKASMNSLDSTTGAWDTLRVLLHLNQLDATHMSGTMDFWVSINGGPEIQLANNALLQTTTIPVLDPTSLQFRIVKGGDSGLDYYDNISITTTVVPEPASMGLAAAAFGLLIRRNRK